MENVTINANDVKKDLYKSKVNAKFSHYTSGNLYYTVQLTDGIYQFPISTIELKSLNEIYKDDIFYVPNKEENETIEPFKGTLFESSTEIGAFDEVKFTNLSSDLGTTDFNNEMKGSDLNRWIAKAIDKNDFIKVG